MSAWSWGRKATILVRISPSAVATRTEMAFRPFQGLGVGERAGVQGQDWLEPSIRTRPKGN